jgi:glycerol-3-phosphate acyltransferase PlsY
MEDLLLYLGAYLIGSIPVDYLVLKGFKGIQLGKEGGRIGATRVWKLAGAPFGLLALALDAVKGAAAIFWAHALSPADQPDWVLAGLLALLGDEFSVFLKFKGDRAIGTIVGVFGSILFWMMAK